MKKLLALFALRRNSPRARVMRSAISVAVLVAMLAWAARRLSWVTRYLAISVPMDDRTAWLARHYRDITSDYEDASVLASCELCKANYRHRRAIAVGRVLQSYSVLMLGHRQQTGNCQTTGKCLAILANKAACHKIAPRPPHGQGGAKRVLVHFGGGSAVASGLIDRVGASLDAAGIEHLELREAA